MAPTFAATAAGYTNLWNKMVITRASALERDARRILAGRARYLAVERQTGVPWYWIGCAHMRESSCNFAGVLHNGEHIIGKGRKTRLVPAGRGPFTSWEQAAIDALKLKGLEKIKDWSVARMGFEFERFNGFGYMTNKRGNSPYVWAGSQHYVKGKYIRDGVYSSTHVDTQNGCMPLLRTLMKLSAEVDERVRGKVRAAAPETTAATTTAGVVITTAETTVADPSWGTSEYLALLAVIIVVSAVVFYFVRKYRKKEIPAAALPAPLLDEGRIDERAGVATEG